MTVKYYNLSEWNTDLISGTKILMLGCPGSGKSTFSKQLSLKLKLPVIHMDDEYWENGWRRTEEQKFRQRILDVLTSDQWILDGNYAGILEDRLAYADTVIMLELSPLTCLFRVFWRAMKRRAGETSSLPRKIRDNPSFSLRPNFKFLSKIMFFNVRTMPKMKQELLNFSITHDVYWINMGH